MVRPAVMSDALLMADEIRSRFARAISRMYQNEVPQYGTLLRLVANVNEATLAADPIARTRLSQNGELDRINLERHGATRLGTAGELGVMRRLFAVMGMVPVGYYDLSTAGVPVHSTAFRPVSDASLALNPFRMFTSLLRLDLIEDAALRDEAAAILARRRIFTDAALALIERFEVDGALGSDDADRFVAEAMETFRWHRYARVNAETYDRLSRAHPLIADVVSFAGPHINHLTPRTLDIDAVQAAMPAWGMGGKDMVEGPPARRCPILLRQTSFQALREPAVFEGVAGAHTARFGEIEQRGLALTRNGRTLYDTMLARVRRADPSDRARNLADAFADFPDTEDAVRRRKLGFFRYVSRHDSLPDLPLEDLVRSGCVTAHPIVYEDFLPVSAAGIFQSNLGSSTRHDYRAGTNRKAFVAALGCEPLDEFALYAEAERRSIEALPRTAGA